MQSIITSSFPGSLTVPNLGADTLEKDKILSGGGPFTGLPLRMIQSPAITAFTIALPLEGKDGDEDPNGGGTEAEVACLLGLLLLDNGDPFKDDLAADIDDAELTVDPLE